VKITGFAPDFTRGYERNDAIFDELVYLAAQSLEMYRPTTLITSLEPGWDQALAKAALGLNIPLHVALPYPEQEWFIQANYPNLYQDLLPKAKYIECMGEGYHPAAGLECRRWRVNRADLALTLWDYGFSGETFELIDFALKAGKKVVNLWEDWSRLDSLRSDLASIYQSVRAGGALIFPKKS
jgi:hypothetical protein